MVYGLYEWLGSFEAIVAFIFLAYGLNLAMCIAWKAAFRKMRDESEASMDSALLNAIGISCIFVLLLSLYLLFMAYGMSYAFTEFLLAWLRVDLNVIAMFLTAPIPPIVA